MNTNSPIIKALPHLIALVVLGFVLLFVLSKFGYVRACTIPVFSNVYYAINGYPRVGIVYDPSEDTDTMSYGTGDPELLYNTIIARTHVIPDMIPINQLIAAGLLTDYGVIIVEHAKQIDTPLLYGFKDYVTKGGKLVWIGDAGTQLNSERDYICEEVKFEWLASTKVDKADRCNQLPEDVTDPVTKEVTYVRQYCTENRCILIKDSVQKQYCEQANAGEVCGDKWNSKEPKNPEDFPGICGHTFGEVVKNFIAENESIWAQTHTGNIDLCSTVEDNYKITGAKRITACIDHIENDCKYPDGKSLEVTSTTSSNLIDNLCSFEKTNSGSLVCNSKFLYGVNYWDRGPSETVTGEKVNAIDFGSIVLGMDYVGFAGAKDLFMQPVKTDHPLTIGYSVGVNNWYGAQETAVVDLSRYTYRSTEIMDLVMNLNGKQTYIPAIAISSPVGPLLTNTGLVVYYSFPIEGGIEPGNPLKGKGANLINNLIDFVTC